MDTSRNRSTRSKPADDTRLKAGASEAIVLNPAESERFIKSLNAEPTPPTPRMARALNLYRDTVVER